ncbi:MAG: hypothetical protein ACTHN0_12955, partial [Aquihabitans sp.]
FRVTSDHARFLHVSMGPGAVDAFRDLHEVLVPDPTLDDIEAALAVMARHGIDIVLPDDASANQAVAS